jgi:uncharacterized protein with HEPN domain
MRPRTSVVLGDTLQSIEYIAEDTDGMSYAEFARDRRARQLVAHNFEIIGEALNRLRREALPIAEQLSSSNQYIALRNVLIHGYDVIDDAIVWNIAQENLPTLQSEVRALLQGSPG